MTRIATKFTFDNLVKQIEDSKLLDVCAELAEYLAELVEAQEFEKSAVVRECINRVNALRADHV